MWIWWSITIALCAWKIGEGLVRPHRMLEWPFLACAMWAYFYGWMAYDAKVKMPEYLGNGMSDIGQLMPLLCLIGVLVGWNFGTRNKQPRPPDDRVYPYFRIWCAGMFFLVTGAAGGYSVMHFIQAPTGDLHEESGYWFLFFYVGYPGLAMVVWSLFRMPPSSSRFYLWIIAIVALAAFMFPHIAGAKRGPLFPTIMILLLVPPMTTRRSPNPFIFFGSLAVAGVVMLVFLQIRETTYNGGSWNEALQRLDVGAAVTEKVEIPEDNEYINSCQLISTVYLNGKYQYATGHMGLLWHWVPRSIWKDKPTLGEGNYSFNELFDDVEATTGFRLLGGGAAAAGVADTFVQYGVFCPLFWLLLSWGMGAAYVRARIVQSPRWLFCYIGFICASHWLVSQSLAAAFVPGMFFQIVPVVVFLVLDPPGGRRVPVPIRHSRSTGPLGATRALSP
jgi:hypothetical protein